MNIFLEKREKWKTMKQQQEQAYALWLSDA
jgi:hypothetical protein